MRKITLIKLFSKTLLVLMLTSCIATRKNVVKAPNIKESEINKIIWYASLAGNSHNTQPWKVQVEQGGSVLTVIPDFSRKLKVVDPTSRGLFISIGAFVENLCQASSYFGYETEVAVSGKEINENCTVKIKLHKSKKGNVNISTLEQRMTLRTPYSKNSIKKEDVNTLLTDTDNCTKFISMDNIQGKYIAAKTLEAYASQSVRDDAKNELAEWIRFSNKHVKEKKDGLTTAGMGINGFAGVMVSLMYKQEDSKKESFVNKGIENAKNQTENCGGWLLIVTESDSPENWIKTGRIYQRINLRCRDLMIGMHPMNQMIEEPQFEEESNKYLNINGKIQFVARIGYVDKYPQPVSVRRDIKDFVNVK
jgi:hypothetical protein